MKPPAVPLTFDVNGRTETIEVQPHHTLLEVLRDQLHLTGTKECCSCGECGACTVLLNGRAICSCLMLAAEADGDKVTTIEGLAADGRLDPLQEAFVSHGAVQCGFCIPGMVMTAKSFLDRNEGRVPSRGEIREAIAGTLCRCTGYGKIVDAIAAEAQRRNAEA